MSDSDSKLTASAPCVVLIGRVNVGKSTLFNRLSGNKRALISNLPGTTRDSQLETIEWRGKTIQLTDTGGIDLKPINEIEKQIQKMSQRSLKQADVIVVVTDAKQGVTPLDKEAVLLAKKQGVPVLLTVNKADNPKKWDGLKLEFSELGLDPILISALTGAGTGDLLDIITNSVPETISEAKPKTEIIKHLSISVIGQPNVGKSSLINAIIKQPKQIVSAQPHTTRDAQNIEFTYKDFPMILVDTAGIRKHTIKADRLEKFSIKQAIKSIQKSDVTLLVIDISKPLTSQDKKLADQTARNGNSLIIIANKYDLITDKNTNTQTDLKSYIRYHLPFVDWAPIIFTSAMEPNSVRDILPKIISIYSERRRQIQANALNKFLKKIITNHPPSRGKGTAHPYIYRIIQTDINPPTFAIHIKYKRSLHASYLKYIKRQLRESFGFTGTPIIIYVESLK